MPARLPHPIPYQGSKRRLAGRILETLGGARFERLFEPFAGSAAITIAARARGIAAAHVVGDSLAPLAALWQRILDEPQAIAAAYESLWLDQLREGRGHFLRVRAEFNGDGDAAKLLYLLARCVKSAPRFNAAGGFNQSADQRRRGARPDRMRREIEGASALLGGVTTTTAGDFEETLAAATPDDLAYLDPPWHGTSAGADKRYHQPLTRARLIAALEKLNRRAVPWLLSYDGRHGDRDYGPPLPQSLSALRLDLPAGRSSQATLNGRTTLTIESLYVSAQLADRCRISVPPGYNDAPRGRGPRPTRAISSVG